MARKKIKLPADSLAFGVSQQTETRQTLNHCLERINVLPSLVYGNTKRPASVFKARLDLPSGPAQEFAEHFYTRDSLESYLVVHTGSELRVFDQQSGERKTVNSPNGLGYLASPNSPFEDFTFLTLGDHTFVCNKTVETKLSTATSAAFPNKALLYVSQGDYGVTYTVNVDGIDQATLTTSETLVAETSTEFIMQGLKTQLVANLAGQPFSVNGDGSVLEVTRTDDTPFTVTATDSLTNEAIRAVKGSIQRFEDLPDRAPDGYSVHVTRTGGVDVDDFYVRFVADDPSNPASEGVWVETLGPGLQIGFDPATMPHVLVRLADGTFEFKQSDWGERKAGDDATVPAPSFVGRKINDLFFFQNRLGFLAGSNLITSRTSDYQNFWRKSARTKLDTDPVDVAATTETALNLLYAFPFDEKLVIFGDKALLISRGGNKYTPATAAMDVSEEYELDGNTQPVSVGGSLFYTVKNGSHLAVMEARASDSRATRLPVDEVTRHVPKYIPSGSYRMVASSKSNLLVMIPRAGGPMFSYNWLRSEGRLVLSSWGKQAISGSALPWGASFAENTLALLVPHGDQQTLLHLTLAEDGRFVPGLDDIHLDFLTEGDLSFNSETNTTTVSVPLSYSAPTVLVEDAEGSVSEVQSQIFDQTSLPDDGAPSSALWRFQVNGQPSRVVVGEVAQALHKFNRPYPLRYGPRGEMVPDLTKRMQATRLTVNLSNTGPCKVTVERPDRDTREEHFTGLLVGGSTSLVGGAPVASGPFKVGLRGKTEELTVTLTSSTWMPLSFASAEWAGTLMRKL